MAPSKETKSKEIDWQAISLAKVVKKQLSNEPWKLNRKTQNQEEFLDYHSKGKHQKRKHSRFSEAASGLLFSQWGKDKLKIREASFWPEDARFHIACRLQEIGNL